MRVIEVHLHKPAEDKDIPKRSRSLSIRATHTTRTYIRSNSPHTSTTTAPSMSRSHSVRSDTGLSRSSSLRTSEPAEHRVTNRPRARSNTLALPSPRCPRSSSRDSAIYLAPPELHSRHSSPPPRSFGYSYTGSSSSTSSSRASSSTRSSAMERGSSTSSSSNSPPRHRARSQSVSFIAPPAAAASGRTLVIFTPGEEPKPRRASFYEDEGFYELERPRRADSVYVDGRGRPSRRSSPEGFVVGGGHSRGSSRNSEAAYATVEGRGRSSSQRRTVVL